MNSSSRRGVEVGFHPERRGRAHATGGLATKRSESPLPATLAVPPAETTPLLGSRCTRWECAPASPPRPPYLPRRHRPFQIRQRRPRLHQDRSRRRVRVPDEEPPGGELAQRARSALCGRRRRRLGLVLGEAVEDAVAVGVGLQAAEGPEAGVRQRAVVEVHGVLRGDEHADRRRRSASTESSTYSRLRAGSASRPSRRSTSDTAALSAWRAASGSVSQRLERCSRDESTCRGSRRRRPA